MGLDSVRHRQNIGLVSLVQFRQDSLYTLFIVYTCKSYSHFLLFIRTFPFSRTNSFNISSIKQGKYTINKIKLNIREINVLVLFKKKTKVHITRISFTYAITKVVSSILVS